jgi:hypothetical protein
VSVTNVWVVVGTAAGTSATDAGVIAVSNSRRANASSDHAAGAPGGAPGAPPVADGSSRPPNRFDTAPVTISTGSAGTIAAGAAACLEITVGAVGSAAETLATETSPIVAVTGDVATLSIGAVAAARTVLSTFGTAVAPAAAADEIIVEFHDRCVATSVSERDFPLGASRGAAAVEGCVIESFDVVSSGMEGAVNRAVGVVALLGEPPVLTAPPEASASDVVCAPVDVEDPDGELVEAPDDELVEPPDGELVEDPDEESDDELDGSACASPCPESTATPTPSVKTRPANRPMRCTASLTSTIRTITTSTAKENKAGGVRMLGVDIGCSTISGLEDSSTPLVETAADPSGGSMCSEASHPARIGAPPPRSAGLRDTYHLSAPTARDPA